MFIRMRKLAAVSLTVLAVASTTALGADRRRATAVYRVDLMELYTAESVTMNGSRTAIDERIRRAVDQLNADFARSGIGNVFFRLVYVGQIELPTYGSLFDILASLPENHSITDLRNAYGADLVGVWSELSGGEAFTPDVNHPTPYTGYHVVCADPSVPDYLYMFSHEVGHNFGAMHEDGPTSAKGYCGEVRDLMAVLCTAPLVRAFSSVDTTWNGYAIGDVGHDNASVMRQMIPYVSGFAH